MSYKIVVPVLKALKTLRPGFSLMKIPEDSIKYKSGLETTHLSTPPQKLLSFFSGTKLPGFAAEWSRPKERLVFC